MIEKMIFQKTVIPLISKGLDAMITRQTAIAENIANAQSSGYERKVVLFEDELQSRMKKTDRKMYLTNEKHLPSKMNIRGLNPRVQIAKGSDKEVVIEREMTDLAQTQLKFEAEIKIAFRQFERLKMAISGHK